MFYLLLFTIILFHSTYSFAENFTEFSIICHHQLVAYTYGVFIRNSNSSTIITCVDDSSDRLACGVVLLADFSLLTTCIDAKHNKHPKMIHRKYCNFQKIIKTQEQENRRRNNNFYLCICYENLCNNIDSNDSVVEDDRRLLNQRLFSQLMMNSTIRTIDWHQSIERVWISKDLLPVWLIVVIIVAMTAVTFFLFRNCIKVECAAT
jgi:hypothetical protein